MSTYDKYLAQRRGVWADRLTTDEIDERYIVYWEAGVTVMVRWPDGTTLIGRPVFWGGPEERFLLMLDNAVGSTHVLTPDTEILGVSWNGTDWDALVEDMPDPATVTSIDEGEEGSPLSPRSPDV